VSPEEKINTALEKTAKEKVPARGTLTLSLDLSGD
jgi:hypothetical protein